MNKIIATIAIAFTFFVILVVSGIAWLAFSDLSRYKPAAEARLTEAIGRTVTINGNFIVDAFPNPQLTASDITIGNNSHISEFHIEISLWSLLGRLVVNDFILKDADILWDATEKDDDGSQLASRTAEKATRKGAKNLPIIRRADIKNVTLHYVDRNEQSEVSGTFDGNINLQGRRNNLRGNINLQSGNMSVSRKLKFLKSEKPTTIKGCILLEVPVEKSIANLQKVVAVSDKGTAKAAGSLNLAKQTIDASTDVMIAQLQTGTTIKISGPLSDLKYEHQSININIGGLLKGVANSLARALTGQASQGGIQPCRALADG